MFAHKYNGLLTELEILLSEKQFKGMVAVISNCMSFYYIEKLIMSPFVTTIHLNAILINLYSRFYYDWNYNFNNGEDSYWLFTQHRNRRWNFSGE